MVVIAARTWWSGGGLADFEANATRRAKSMVVSRDLRETGFNSVLEFGPRNIGRIAHQYFLKRHWSFSKEKPPLEVSCLAAKALYHRSPATHRPRESLWVKP
jgi:hypothetical protein